MARLGGDEFAVTFTAREAVYAAEVARKVHAALETPLDLSSVLIDVKASAVSLGNPGRGDIALGQRVFHSKFGYGTVAEIEGNKLEIDFEKAGRKRVLDSFVSVE